MTRNVFYLVCALALSGCAHHYMIKLNNGAQVATASKPQLKGGNYVFKDANGREVSIPRSRVREIAPASMAQEDSDRFKPTTSK
jgi:hypothetical protein